MEFADTAPDVFEIAALRFARTADRNYRETTLCQVRRDCAPSIRRPFLVCEHWRRVDDGVFAVERNGRGLRRCGANQLRNARNVESIGKPKILLDAVKFLRCGDGSMQRYTFKRACKPWIGICCHPNTPPAGGESEDGRSISALRRYRDVVRAPQAPDQSQAFRRRRSLPHREDTVDVRVSGNNSRGAVEHQHIDFRLRPSAVDAADHRRRQQQVADAAQRDDQDAGGERGHAGFSQNRNYRSMAVRPSDLSDCRRDSRNAFCCAFS